MGLPGRDKLGKLMSGFASPSGAYVVRPVIWKLKSLGLEAEAESQTLVKLVKVSVAIGRREVTRTKR